MVDRSPVLLERIRLVDQPAGVEPGGDVQGDVEGAPIDVAVDASADFDEIAGIGAGRILAIGRDVLARDASDGSM